MTNDSTGEEGVKACPFCGEPPMTMLKEDCSGVSRFAWCKSIGCPSGMMRLDLWNRRASPSKADGTVTPDDEIDPENIYLKPPPPKNLKKYMLVPATSVEPGTGESALDRLIERVELHLSGRTDLMKGFPRELCERARQEADGLRSCNKTWELRVDSMSELWNNAKRERDEARAMLPSPSSLRLVARELWKNRNQYSPYASGVEQFEAILARHLIGGGKE